MDARQRLFWELMVEKNGKCEPSREKYPKSSTHTFRCSILRSTAYTISNCTLRFIKLQVLKASPLVYSNPTVLLHKHPSIMLKTRHHTAARTDKYVTPLLEELEDLRNQLDNRRLGSKRRSDCKCFRRVFSGASGDSNSDILI